MAWRQAATEQLSKATKTVQVTPHQRFDRAAASRCPVRTAAAPWLALLAAKVTPKQQGDTNVPWPCRCPGPTASTPTPHPRFVLGQSLVARSRCDLEAATGAKHRVGLEATSPAPVIKSRRGSPASSGGCQESSWAGFTLQGFGLFAGMGRLGAGGSQGALRDRGHRASESAAAARGGSGHCSSSSTTIKAARRHRDGKPERKTDWERKGRGSGRGGDQAHLLPEMNEEARASKQHHRREENKILSFFSQS